MSNTILYYNEKEVRIESNSSKEHIFVLFDSKTDMYDFWDDFEENGYQSYSIQKNGETTEATGLGLIGVVVKYKYADTQSYLIRIDVDVEVQ